MFTRLLESIPAAASILLQYVRLKRLSARASSTFYLFIMAQSARGQLISFTRSANALHERTMSPQSTDKYAVFLISFSPRAIADKVKTV